MILPFKPIYCVHNWCNDHEQLFILFLPSLSTCSMTTEAMVNWLVLFFFHGFFCISLLYNCSELTQWPSAVLILFFATLSASSMITEAMVSWLLPFLPSLCTYSILCTLETFCFFHDNWNNGQLIGFIFSPLFVPILFCVLWSHQWDLLFIGVVS